MLGFQKWENQSNIKKPLFLEWIQWNHRGLEICVEENTEEKNRITLLFDGVVYSYTNTLESYKPSVWIGKEEEYYPFYYSYDTEEAKKLRKEVEWIDEEIIHFVIVGIDNVIDIFTSEFPKILESHHKK